MPQRNLLSPTTWDELRKYRDEGLVYTPDMNPVKPDPGMFQHKVGPLQKDNLENTKLSPSEENDYQNWLRFYKNKDVDPKTNELFPDVRYDMRGYFKANTPDNSKGAKVIGSGPPQFNEAHGPDTFKQHGHPTFSAESKYSRGLQDGGRWIGDTLIPPPVSSHGLSPEINVPGGLERKNSLGALKKATSIGPTRYPKDNEQAQEIEKLNYAPEGIRDLQDFNLKTEDFLKDFASYLPINPPSEGMAVSRFITKGVPDKIARIYSGEEFLKSAGKFPELKAAAARFAERYPRVAAHMRINPKASPNTVNNAWLEAHEPGITEGIIDKYHSPMNVQFTHTGLAQDAEGRANTLFHEGTHVAQKLGQGDAFNPLYNNAQQLYDYKYIPQEIGANRSGLRNMEPAQAGFNNPNAPEVAIPTRENIAKFMDSKGFNANRSLNNLLDADIAGTLSPHMKAGPRQALLTPDQAKSLAEKTKRILDNRKFGSLKPGQKITLNLNDGTPSMDTIVNEANMKAINKLKNSGKITIHSLK